MAAADAPRRDRVLVIALSDLSMTARVVRQVEFLSERYEVVVAGMDKSGLPDDIAFVELGGDPLRPVLRRAQSAGRVGLRGARLYERAYWFDARMRRWRDEVRRALPLQAIVVNELSILPLAMSVQERTPVIFDSHEHWTSESASWTRLQRLSMGTAHEWLVDRYVPRAAAMMTVSSGIAEDYARRTGVRPHLVTNAPNFHALSPSEVTEPIRLLHIGLADERRRLEDTIDAVRSLDGRFQLDMILRWDNAYRKRLERLAATDERIRILPPVPNRDLIPLSNGYDVGVFLLPANFPNQVHVLPNKLFDYIQARLAVAIGPSPEMARIVKEWDCGVVAASFTAEAFAEVLARLTVDEVARMKRNADRAAHVLMADANRDTVVSMVADAIAKTRAAA
jgi:hypothetical protein